MLRVQRKNYCIYLSLFFAIVLQTVGCGGGGIKTTVGSKPGDTASGASRLIRLVGSVFAGPVSGATVNVYQVASNGARGALVASTTTDTSGNYSVEVSEELGPLTVVTTGGSYTEEASGNLVNQGATEMAAMLPSPVTASSVAVTPLTHIAAQRAMAQAALGTPVANAISAANQAVALAGGLSGSADVVSTRPANPTISLALQGIAAGSDEAKYGLLLAAISQYGATHGGVNSLRVMEAIADDFKNDGLIYGTNNGSGITVTGGQTLNFNYWYDEIATAQTTFVGGANNQAGFTGASQTTPNPEPGSVVVAPNTLSYSSNAPTYSVGIAIVDNTPSNAGGTVRWYSVSPALPAGLSLNNLTGIISGTPLTPQASANYTVTASNAAGSATRVLNLAIEQPIAQFAAASSSVAESAGTVNLTVNLSGASSQTVTVDYAVTGGTATGGGVDYTLASGTLTFNAGQTSRTISIAVNDDALDEDDETIEITISNPVNATLGATSVHTLTCADNDNAPTVAYAAATSSGSEGTTPAELTVDLSAASGKVITVDYAVTGGTASSAGTDFTLASGTLTFNPGQTSRKISIAINDDALDENDETIEVTISNPSNATLGATAVHSYTIIDNDAAPSLSFSAATSSGSEGVAAVSLTVNLSAASGKTVSVDYSVDTGGSTATGAGTDYTLASGTLTFSPGDVSKTISLAITDDSLDEDNETIKVDLANSSNASIGATGSHVYTINDDDPLPSLSFSASSSTGAEEVTPATLTVNLSAASGRSVTVDYSVTGGTATGSGTDYTLANGTLTFNAGQTSRTISIAIVDDALFESEETVIVTLSNVSNATLVAPVAHTFTISDNENTAPSITAPANRTFPISGSTPPLYPGTAYTLTATATDVENDTPITWSCTYESLGFASSDPNHVSAPTNCIALPSLVTTNGVLVKGTASFSNGALTWTPLTTQRGTFKFNVTAQDSRGKASTSAFYATVGENVFATNLILSLEGYASARNASASANYGSIPRPDGTASDNFDAWEENRSQQDASLATFGTANPWSGSGTGADPYALNFDAANSDYISIGGNSTAFTRGGAMLWIKPSAVETKNSVILDTGDGSGGGIVLRQSASNPGKLEIKNHNSIIYSESVIADAPAIYYRMSDTTATLEDVSGNSRNGIYLSTYTQGSISALIGDSDASTAFGGNGFAVCSSAPYSAVALSVELWVKKTAESSGQQIIAKGANNGAGNYDWSLLLDNSATGEAYFRINTSGGFVDSPKSGPLTLNTWYHLVGVYDGAELHLYVNGVSQGTPTAENRPITNGGANLSIGGLSDAVTTLNGFSGEIDEVAIYNSALTSARVLAHYDARTRSVARSLAKLKNNRWYHVALAFFNSGASGHRLVINGKQNEAYTSSYTPSGANIRLGGASGSTDFWSGAIADLKYHGSTSGSSPTAINTQTTFNASANRFRTVPLEDLASVSAATHFDVAYGEGGVYAHANGCASETLTWAGIGDTNVNYFGSLTGFDTCGTYGWKGSGTAVDPHRLAFDGSNDLVTIPDNNNNSPTAAFTVEMWVNQTALANSKGIISKQAAGQNSWSLATDSANSSRLVGCVSNALTDTCSNYGLTPASSWSTGWHHVAMVYSGAGANNAARLLIYIDGAAQALTFTGTIPAAVPDSTSALRIGTSESHTGFWNGDVSIVRMFSSALTQAQIRQNCHAQKARFQGASCTGP